jgi:hypothetical protein
LTKEVLLVDLLPNLKRLPNDEAKVLPRALEQARKMDRARLNRPVRDFGSARARRMLLDGPASKTVDGCCSTRRRTWPK